MDKYNIFVSINYRVNSIDGIKNSARVNNVNTNSSKYLIGSGILNKNGGNIVFTAKTLEEVRQVTKGKYFCKNVPMKYKVAMIPKEI